MTDARLLSALALGAVLTFSGTAIAAEASTNGGTAPAAKPVTFAKDVAPILQEKCQECHRKGSMAPMSLVTYEETRPWAKSIRQRVITRQMPPWHIDKTVGVQKFKNDMSLTRRADRDHRALGGFGRAAGRSERHAALPGSGPLDNEWKAAKELGQPDLVSSPSPTRWRRIIRTSGGGRLRTFRSPSRAGCARSRSGQTTAAGRRITHHAVAYLVQDDPDSVAPGAGDSDLGARALPDGMGHRQGLRPVPSRTPASCCCPARRFPGTSIFTPWAKRFGTTSNWASGFIPKGRSRSIGPT